MHYCIKNKVLNNDNNNNNGNGNNNHNDNSFIFLVLLLFFYYAYYFIYLFQRWMQTSACIIIFLLKGEVTLKFKSFNAAFWSWRWGDWLKVHCSSETIFGSWKHFKNDGKLFLFQVKSFSLFSRYLNFWSWRFGHVAKWLDKKDKVNFMFYDVTAWLTSDCNTHIAQYLEK